MTQATQLDWLKEGLVVLAESGHRDLKIDTLAKRLDVTKGSFYHHFKNLQDYKMQLLAFWQKEITEDVIEFAEATDTETNDDTSIGAILDRIMDQVASYAVDPESAIRTWAQVDEDVREVLAQVDNRRLTYAQALFEPHTGSEESARMMGLLLYSMIVGADYLQPPISVEDRWRLHHEFKRLYGLD